jgi:hypothetical protein
MYQLNKFSAESGLKFFQFHPETGKEENNPE